MKQRRFHVLALSLLMVLSLSLTACGGTATTASSAAATSAAAAETTAPAEGGAKVVYTNGGPEEFFETPWLNPGTFMYNKSVYAHLIVADENLSPVPNSPDALATYE